MNNGLYHIQNNKIYKMSLNEPMKKIGVVASIDDRNNLIDGFANELINKIESKYPDQKKGIFLANDTYANMFLNLIFQKYGTFPSTYEIVGFDNSPIASEAILPITTVGQQIDVIAKTAMDLLVRQMDEQKKRAPKPLGEPIHKQITPILIRRNTTQ